jgi:hypothetical protein
MPVAAKPQVKCSACASRRHQSCTGDGCTCDYCYAFLDRKIHHPVDAGTLLRILRNIALVALLAIPVLAQGPPNLGEVCTNGCGIGSHILPSTLTVTLCDTANVGCASTIPAQSNISSYPTLPLTIDARNINFDWQTDVPANGFVVCGSEQQNSDRIQFDTSAPGVWVIGTHHHVTVTGLVPASHSGGGGGAGVSCYVGDNINATTSNPQQRYAPGTNTWPGPLCYAGGPACSLYITPPNPTAATLQWSATPAGIINAQRGFPAQIPLYILWNGGNATSVAGFPACNSGTINQMYHQYQTNQWSAPNSGTWFQCKNPGPAWTSLGSQLPQFLVTSSTITDPSANVYTCPGSANGGETASGIPRLPANTCTGGAGDSHISVTPFYTGIYVGNSPQTDYRPIHYSSSPAGYYFDMNGTAVPVNAVPTSTVQFFPAATATTGTWTGTLTFTMYTDSTLTTPAAGTAPFTFSYSISVGDDTPITQTDPGSYPADPNLSAWTNYTSQQSVGMCSDATGGTGDAMDYFNLNLHYWMWLTFSAGDWGPYNTGNYDNSRWFSTAGDFFLKQLNGSAWPDWAATTAYGSSQATSEVTPSTDPNGNTWVATVNGGTSGGSAPAWSSIPSPVANTLLTDGSQRWRNVGKLPYWNRCTENAGMAFDNQIIQAPGPPLWAQFTGAEERHRQRTGDAVLKGTTTYQNFYSQAEKSNVTVGGGFWSEYSPSAGRGTAYALMALATYWKTVCDEGNCAAFTGSDQLKRAWFWDTNASIEFLQIHELTNPLVTDPTQTYWPTLDPLHPGVIEEALRESYIRDKELDPTNAQGLADPRIIPEMTKFADFAYFNWYNQTRVQGEGVDCWSMSYNPMDAQTRAILEPCFTELVGPIATTYPFLGRYNGNAFMSDGTTTWFAASDIILKHIYDGRANCNNWFCSTYSIPYAGGSGVPKTAGQVWKEEMGNAQQYRYGAYTPFEDDLSPQHNPCWTGGSVPCTSPAPYPDTMAPYAFQLHANGTEQDDPTCEGAYTGDAACSPIINVTANSAIFRINFYEPLSSIRVDYGTTVACTTGSSSVEVGGYPRPINGANQSHTDQIQLSGLTPSTQYWARYCATDLAGNQSCNTCTPISGGFRGGGIKFTTSTQTVLSILTTSPLPNGSINVVYPAFNMQAAGGTPPYAWTYTGTLPTGMALSGGGLLNGTPTQAGVFIINVSVTDNVGNHAGPVALQLTITNLSIVTASLPGGTQGVPYSQLLTASGGVTPYTWSVAAGPLPAGLNLTASGNQGLISGTPTACKTYPTAFKVTDANGTFAIKSLPIVISGCGGSLTLTCPLFPNVQVNTVYPSTSCDIIGGVSPYTCSLSAGALPTGMNVAVSASACVVAGTPTVAGPYSFTIEAQDSTTPTAFTAFANGTFTVFSSGQLGLTVTGSTTATGSVTFGVVPPAPSPSSPSGP